MKKRLGRRGLGLLVAATALIAIAGGAGYAAIPNSSTGTINGCYEKKTGLLRVIDTQAGKHCGSWEIPISWSQQGLKGEAGAQGPAGPAGAAGATGPQGLKGDKGDTGPAGAAGLAGAAGPKGDTGDTGDTGEAGETGATGPKGDQGIQGPKGDTGASGPSGAAGATGPPGEAGTTGQDATTVYGTTRLTLVSSTFVAVPGLSQTFTVPANSVVYISSDGGVACNNDSTTGISVVDVAFRIDGASPSNAGYRRLFAANSPQAFVGGAENWSFEETLTLTPGTHTVTVEARWAFGNCPAGVSGSNVSPLQGQLTVMILKR